MTSGTTTSILGATLQTRRAPIIYCKHTEEFATYSVHEFFSEYDSTYLGRGGGVLLVTLSQKSKRSMVYGDQMHSVFSDGIAYEYPGADQKYEDADWH